MALFIGVRFHFCPRDQFFAVGYIEYRALGSGSRGMVRGPSEKVYKYIAAAFIKR